jgi:glycosyltransferase involved in cell wall biosynthesis
LIFACKTHTPTGSPKVSGMKVLVDCTPLAWGGGVQGAIALLVNLRQQSDIDWQAVVPIPLQSFLPPEVAFDARVFFVQKRHNFDRVWLRYKLPHIEAAFAPDIVFTVSGPAYFRARAYHVVGFALPTLIYKPDGPLTSPTLLGKLTDWLRCIALRQADHFAVQTQVVADRLARRLQIDPDRISVIGNCVNPLLAQHSPGEDPPIGCFGILIPTAYYLHKNLEITPPVAAAMRRLDPELDFEFRFTLEPSSPHWRAIAAEAKRLGIADRLVAVGTLRLNELALAYRAASAVFLPTLREASTAVYPESFFFERPLVTSDMDFARELCGDAAIFVPPQDVDQIAARLIELARSAELRSRLITAGRRQLPRAYPSSSEKFKLQVELLHRVIATRNIDARRQR